MTDVSMCAAADMSSGSPQTELGTVLRACPMLGTGQHQEHQILNNARYTSSKSPRLTRQEHGPTDSLHPDPIFPPGFGPAVRLHCTQEFPGLATESVNTRTPTVDGSNSTSAVDQLSFSLAIANESQTPPPHAFSKILTRSQAPPPGLPNQAIITPPDLPVASQAESIPLLPVISQTAGAEADNNEANTNAAPAPVGPAFPANSEVKGMLLSGSFMLLLSYWHISFPLLMHVCHI